MAPEGRTMKFGPPTKWADVDHCHSVNGALATPMVALSPSGTVRRINAIIRPSGRNRTVVSSPPGTFSSTILVQLTPSVLVTKSTRRESPEVSLLDHPYFETP